MSRGQAERIRQYYNVPAKRGMHITVAGKSAVIVGFARFRLRIRYPDEPILGIMDAHPTWSVVYP